MKRTSFALLGFIWFTLMVCPGISLAFQSTFHLDFSTSELVFEKVKGYDLVRLAEGRFAFDAGAPQLPAKFVQIAIPTDLEVERVEVISFEYQELAGTYNIYPTQPLYPVSQLPTKEEEIEFVEPDPSVYAQASEYPGRLAQLTNNGFLGGQHIAGVALYPLQYVPSEGNLILYTEIEFKLVLKPASHFPVPVIKRSQRQADFYSELARSVVINPEVVQIGTEGMLLQEEEVDYLIITDASFVSAFQQLADWKILRGISTDVQEVSWVLSAYSGADDPDRVRNCIRDYYANHGTKWVLLGGDTDIIPHRNAYVVAGMYSENIPSDYYYSDLDGDWDADGDGVYGEDSDSVDLYPDVFVGRAPCSDLSQAETFINKCLTYEINPPTDYQNRVVYAAEVLWSMPMTDGAELKEYIDSSSVPDYYESTKLYETWSTLNKTALRNALNQGQGFANHSGHANYNVLSIGPDAWYSPDMDELSNAPRYGLFYSHGCISAAIDSDCIGEHFINNPVGGGIAYCGNSRYGWGFTGEPLQGPGAEFDIEFFREIFDQGEHHAGRTLAESKIPFIPIVNETGGCSSYYRWTLYTLLLLGDPTLELWTDTPAELTVSHQSVFVAGLNFFEVNVAQDSALVCCTKDGEILGRAYSLGGTAMLYFDFPLVSPGAMHVTVTRHDHLPYCDSVPVIPPDEPYVVYHSHEIDDSGGNNNGCVNPGETIAASVAVENIGLQAATGIGATLRVDDDYLVITDSVKSFGDIDPGMMTQSIGDYLFQVDASCPDSHLVRFIVEATDGEASWVTYFFLLVAEPDFVLSASRDTVIVEKGDSAVVKLLFNSLGGFSWQVDLNLTPFPPEVTGYLDPDHLVPTDSSFLRMFTTPEVYPGLYPITVSASGGGITRDKEIVLGIMAPSYFGPVWHVSSAGHDSVGNGSEEFPFGSIQKGINVATDGDTVLVERGRYKERIDFRGKSVLVASNFVFDALPSTIESTVIDADHSGRAVTFWSEEDSNSVLRGFTITGGFAGNGPAISCFGSGPTVSNNVFTCNKCATRSSCLAIGFSSTKLVRNVVHGNLSCAQAVAVEMSADAVLANNTIVGNEGGGLLIANGASALVKNNIVSNNQGFGIKVWSAHHDISYNDVFGQTENYTGVEDQTGVNGNISEDPLLADTSADDYRLTADSPCLDGGDPADWIPSGGGPRIDMGAFEYQVDGPWLVHLSHLIDDYGGNNNGVLNPGDIIDMPVTIRNTGTETAYGVSGILSENNDFVVVTDNTQYFEDLEPDLIMAASDNYSFEIEPLCPDSEQVTFELELTDGSSSWISHFTEVIADTDYALITSRDTTMVYRGAYGSVQLVVTSLGGFASQVSLDHSGLPEGVSCEVVPDQLVPTDSSRVTIYATSAVPCGIYPISINALGGGISHQKSFQLMIFLCGDANTDGAVDIGDVICLINYLYRDAPPPYPPEAGDVTWDGSVDIADVVYLLNYLYRDGPAPPGQISPKPREYSQRKTLPGAASARLWLWDKEAPDREKISQVIIRGAFEADLAGFQVSVEFDPRGPKLRSLMPPNLQALQIYSTQKDGLLRLGVLDIHGDGYVPAGNGVDLLILEMDRPAVSSLRIKEAILADRNGRVIPVKIVVEEEKKDSRPEEFALLHNYPNPFNPQTQISYALPQDCDVKLTVYNLLGQRVRILVDEHQMAGYKKIFWDGKDEQGCDVASGIYFYKIQAGEFVQTRKMLLLK